MKAADDSPEAIDLLTRAVEHVRPVLDRRRPLRDRLRDLWAAVAAASDLGARDVVEEDFLALALDTGLSADMDNHHDADLRHVIAWALAGRDPFGGAR
jgi:hypothetical protein